MPNLTLRQEQDAFDAQLDELLRTHPGKHVLFKDGAPVAFFDDNSGAYKAGLDRFGLDTPFLVAEIAKHPPQPVSISWEAGIAID